MTCCTVLNVLCRDAGLRKFTFLNVLCRDAGLGQFVVLIVCVGPDAGLRLQ